MRLLETIRYLDDPALANAIAPFTEGRSALRRLWTLGIIIVWSAYWGFSASTVSLRGEANAVLVVALILLGLSVVWFVVSRRLVARNSTVGNITGSIANLAGLAALMAVGFNLMTPFVILFPLTSIMICIRHGRAALWLSMATSMAIIVLTSPSGYFQSRPVVLLLAAGICIQIPLVVIRIIDGLQIAVNQTVAARDSQSQFMAMMSHELRTPLNGIIGAARLVKAEALDAETRTLLSVIRPNAILLLSRVNDLLDITAVEQGSFQLSPASFDIRAVLKNVEAIIRPDAIATQIALSISVDDTVPHNLVGDARRIGQVLANLAVNAVAYSPPNGGVFIRAEGEHRDADHFALTITVSDTGVGITQEHIARLFDPYLRLDQARSLNREGSGLGLFIVKTLTQQMNGNIDMARRNDGPGSRFTWSVTLPMADSHRPESFARDFDAVLRHHRLTTAPKRCLVIDDNYSSRLTTQRLLETAGHAVIAVSEGSKGLSLLQSASFDVAFIDLYMPVFSGWHVLEALHAMGKARPSAQLIVLSALSDPESKNRAARLGADSYLSKPASSIEILDRIAALDQNGAPPLFSSQLLGKEPSTGLDLMRLLGSEDDVSAWVDAVTIEMTAALEVLGSQTTPTEWVDALHQLKNLFLSLGENDLADQAAAARVALKSDVISAGAVIATIVKRATPVLKALAHPAQARDSALP